LQQNETESEDFFFSLCWQKPVTSDGTFLYTVGAVKGNGA